MVKEYWPRPSNWRAEQSLAAYMAEHAIVGIQGIDTRALVRHIRDHGAQQAVISTVEADPQRLEARARASAGLEGRDLGQRGHLVASPTTGGRRAGSWARAIAARGRLGSPFLSWPTITA